ncbi:MAG: TetR family transcriptional regulator [Pseudomonadota bacterium]
MTSEAETVTRRLKEGPEARSEHRSGRPVGRPKGRSTDRTRMQILDAAEELFAANGFDGTSVRDVARLAGLQLAAIGYHFGPKDELFDAVVHRRAEIMSASRREALADLIATNNERPIPIEDLIRAYVVPFIDSASHGDRGWRNYAALMGRLANSTLGTEVIGRHYDATARDYLEEFRRSLPDIAERELVDGFTYMVAAMLALCADTGRAERLSRKAADDHSVADALDPMVAFFAAGFRTLPTGKT